MKKHITMFSLFFLVMLTTNVVAQQYAILKPTRPGIKSDAIPISIKQLDRLLKKETTFDDITQNIGLSPLDTISHGSSMTVNFGIATGDTCSSYYNPPLPCYIYAIGIIGQSWASEELASGFNLFVNKPAHPWVFEPSLWDGDGCYTRDTLGYQTLLGKKIWGDYGVQINDGDRVWSILTPQLDSDFEPFIVSVAPFGGSYMGTDAFNYTRTDDAPRLAKYYHQGRAGHGAQFVVRNYSCCWLIVVEWYGSVFFWIDPFYYGSVLNADPLHLTCRITDINSVGVGKSGVVSATLHYQVNSGDDKIIQMYLVSGDS